MKNKENFGNREQRQAEEGYSSVNTGLPQDRFQGEKQILNPDQLGGSPAPITDPAGSDSAKSSAAKKIKASISVRPDSSVETLDGKQVGGIPLENTAVTRSVAGFSGQSVADDTSKIPYQAGNYRPTTRYGKKRSEDLFELDNTVSEQIIPEVDDAKDLREAPDAKMGYNGRKQFKQTRGKKNFVGRPQSLLFEASNDLNYHNFTVASCGQMIDKQITSEGVVDNIDIQADYPTVTVRNTDGETVKAVISNPMKKGNYLLEGLKVVIDKGVIKSLSFEESHIPVYSSKIDRDQGNMNWQVDGNNIVKSMIKMQTELGRETTEKWSPLGYVIDQPYQYNMLMHDIEATTGSIMALAYRSAVSSLAFQRNIISKDGVGPVTSAVRMFAEGALGSLKNSTLCDNLDFYGGVWNREMYRKGSAAALIDMFDSVRKYRTKADILGMQRSLALHLSQADNNINPLRVKKEFMYAMDKTHCFSTISGEYNPLLPIHATRRVDIINPLSLNYFLKDWKHPKDLVSYTGEDRAEYDLDTGLKAAYGYSYHDIRNEYYTRVQHPLVAGLLMWLMKHEGHFCRVMGDGTFTIPAVFDYTAPTLFQFMLCSASQYVALQRNVIFRDILFAGEQNTYVWDDLVPLRDNDPLHSTQLTIGEYNSDLKLGKLAPDTALRIMWSDNISVLDQNDNDWIAFNMPWYMSEQAFSASTSDYNSTEGFHDEETAFNMSIPSIRQGVRHEYIDLIKGMTENDVRLAMDRMLNIPTFLKKVTPDDAFATEYQLRGTNAQRAELTSIAALRYDKNSDGRVVVKYKISGDNIDGGSAPIIGAAVYAIPKEIGYIWNRIPDLREIVTALEVTGSGKDSSGFGMDVTTLGKNDPVDEQIWSTVADEVRSYRVREDADTNGAISRSAALSQAYYSAYATPSAYDINSAYTSKIGIVLNASYEDNGYETISDCLFVPRSKTNSDKVGATGVTSFARTMWALLQRFFRPVNPFENCYDSTSSNATRNDPLEACFYFGLCGFLASDYTQAVLERLDTFDQLGLDYTEDVNIKESLIFH